MNDMPVEERLILLLQQARVTALGITNDQWRHRPARGKWSPIEILGHLIDSATHNLARVIEAPSAPSAYPVGEYDQDLLVELHDYQHADVLVLYERLDRLQSSIIAAVRGYGEAELTHPVLLPDGSHTDVRGLVEDYCRHFEHHFRQVERQCGGNLFSGNFSR